MPSAEKACGKRLGGDLGLHTNDRLKPARRIGVRPGGKGTGPATNSSAEARRPANQKIRASCGMRHLPQGAPGAAAIVASAGLSAAAVDVPGGLRRPAA